MQKTLALLLAAALLAVPAASAKTVSVEVPWEKARTIMAEGDYRPKIRVELHSSERLKGKLVGTTDAGLRLMRLRYETKIAKSGSPSGRRQSARRFERQDTETLIERKEIRTIRLRPRKTTRNKYRLLGLLAGIPAGFGAGLFLGVVACGGDLDTCNVAAANTAFFATLIAVPYWLYQRGARADRGTVLIVLDEREPDSSRDGSQAERPSSAKGEQP